MLLIFSINLVKFKKSLATIATLLLGRSEYLVLVALAIGDLSFLFLFLNFRVLTRLADNWHSGN